MRPHGRTPFALTKSCKNEEIMIFETLVVGPLGVNCFILGCEETKEGVVVDPGAEPEKVKAAITRLGLRITCVINTHGHFDHVGGTGRSLKRPARSS